MPIRTYKPTTPTGGVAIKKPTSIQNNGIDDWKVGDLVNHDTFGEGVVISIIGGSILQISFKKEGMKNIIANHPKIKRIKKGGFDA